ncbi:MAG: hypothetical protein ABIA74_05845 [bacterium]
MKFLRSFLITLIFFVIFDDACGMSRFRKKGKSHSEEESVNAVVRIKIDDGDRKEFNFSNNEEIFSYQEFKNKLLRLVTSCQMNSSSKNNVSSKIKNMNNKIETIINNSREIGEKNLNITTEDQLILFNETINTLNSFFTYSLNNIVKKYEKICKKVKQSEEVIVIESIDTEFIDYPFLNSIEFSSKFDQLQKKHEQMKKYISLFFKWLNLFLIQPDEEI